MLTITLNQIREHMPCSEGWEQLLASLGKTHADNEHLPFEHILDSNGLDDAMWALRCVDLAVPRLLAVAFAQDVLHLMRDERSREAVKIAHLYVHGEATDDEMAAARVAARAAAEDAADDAARAAARAAAWVAAQQKQIGHIRALCRAWGEEGE